jgi:hypothetical protein
MNEIETNSPTRQAAMNSLAVVGFIALVVLGISLAIYSARYVPAAVSRLGAAAVSLSQLFTPNQTPSLSVVPTASTTIPFGTTATSTATTTPVKVPPKTTPQPTAGTPVSGIYPVGSGTPVLSGLPDLVVNITAVGYLTSSSTTTFVPATTVPHGDNPAVEFTVKNVGTNVAGPWRFSASIPTSSSYIYQSIPQQELNPGDYIDYTLGFNEPNVGTNQTISVTANFDHAISESNTNNNSSSASITILGS